MKRIELTIYGSNGQPLAEASGDRVCDLVYNDVYDDGTYFEIKTDYDFLKVDLDEHLHPSIIYLPHGYMRYDIPVGEKRLAYHPESFKGDSHHLRLIPVTGEALQQRRNLALNAYDIRNESGWYPHSDANVMTRDESVFESRNAIDGYIDNKGHGQFPYQSWGGGLRDDLEFELYFGRKVCVDEVVVYLRADYEGDHDIHWESGIIEFSDGTTLPIEMHKTTEPMQFSFEEREVEWMKLNHLQREKSSAFSALIELQVMGKEVQ